MKRFLLGIALLSFILIAGGADAASLYRIQGKKTLISGATGTITGAAVTLDDAYSDFTVDVILSAATGTVVVRIDGTGTDSDGKFDTTGLGEPITCGSLKCTAVYNSQPMQVLRAVITSTSGSVNATVKVLGIGR